MSRSESLWSASALAANHLVRSGYGYITAYPGSPTTLITDELARLARHKLVAFRYATNEKIALEMAAAVAFSGRRAAVVMKNAGLNVALDAAITVSYTGHRGALLLVVGDDPSAESSSTEQDSRLLARMLSIPCLEPSSIHDLARTIDLATSLSEETGGLVMLRLTRAVCYSSAQIPYARAAAAQAEAPLSVPARERQFLLLPGAIAQAHRARALERLERARSMGGREEFWEEHGDAEPTAPAFVVQNAVYEPFRRASVRLGVSPATFRTRLSWPLAPEAITPFLRRHSRVIIVEELEDLLEEQTAALAHRERIEARVEGRQRFPRIGELTEERILEALARLYDRPLAPRLGARAALALPPRPPTFCPGCPHTASFYSLKQLLESLPSRPFVASDIGCNGMGTKPGLDIGDTLLAMGSSIGVATAVATAGHTSVAVIGDSTFLHAGLPALYSAVTQEVNLLVCILDNGYAAMTGGPTTPGSDRLAAIALGLGAAAVAVVDPFDVAATAATLRRLLDAPGTNVLIARSPCALTIPAKPRRPRVNREACSGCGDCVTMIQCPAISLDTERKFQVNTDLCVGCGFCSVICPDKALTPEPFPP